MPLPLILAAGLQLLELAGLSLAARYLGPKPDKPQPKGISDFDGPTADPARAIPVVFGSVKLTSPNVVWYGNLGAEGFQINKADAGYYYTLGMDLALCHGPLDSFDGILFDEKDPGWVLQGTAADVSTYQFNSASLFGGNRSGGGVTGNADCFAGVDTPTISSYMQTQCSADYPGLARVAHVVLHGGYKPQYGGVYIGTSPTPRPIAFKVTRCPNSLGMVSGHHRIASAGGYDSNPACILYELLRHTTYGLGRPASDIDLASFLLAGETLFSEGFGLSLIMEQPTEASETIREILRHIDGGISTDPETGLLTLTLVRADYVIGSLPVLDETTLDEIEFGRAGWDETFNVAKVAFTSRADNWTTRIAQWMNLANQQVQGVSVAQQVDYRGISNSAIASRIASRDLRRGSYPFARIKAKSNRKAWALRACDCFVLNAPSYGITGMVCRVTKPAGGKLEDGRLSLEAVEDAFGVSGTGYTPPGGTGWVDPIGAPVACAQQALMEEPYQLADLGGRQVRALAARADATLNGFQIWADPAGGTAYVQSPDVRGWCPYGTLVSSYPANTAALDTTGFDVTNLIDPDFLTSISSTELYYGLNLALIDSEIIAWQTVTPSGGGRTISNVLRGVLDTVPAAHSAGAKVWFFTAGPRAVLNPTGGYASDLTVTAKLLPFNLRSVLPIASATQLSLTTASRALKPLPPGNMVIDSFFPWPTSRPAGVDHVVSWRFRHRTLQAAAGVVVAQDATDYTATPEGNFTIEVRVNGTLKRTVTAITTNNWTWTAAMQVTDSAIAGTSISIRVIPVNGSLIGTYQERVFSLV